MTVLQRLAFGLILSIFAIGCAHDRAACHGSCACEQGGNCDCWRRGECDCQMAYSGMMQPTAGPSTISTTPAVEQLPPELPPEVPAAEGVAVPRPLGDEQLARVHREHAE